MCKKSQLSFSEMLELRDSHIKVSEEVFILLADKDEVKKRKDLVKRYGYYTNVTFFSDGSVFIDGSKNRGATGWISTIPPRNLYENTEIPRLSHFNVDPQSELSPINLNKHPIEQCVETGREVLSDPQKLEYFRNLYQNNVKVN